MSFYGILLTLEYYTKNKNCSEKNFICMYDFVPKVLLKMKYSVEFWFTRGTNCIAKVRIISKTKFTINSQNNKVKKMHYLLFELSLYYFICDIQKDFISFYLNR